MPITAEAIQDELTRAFPARRPRPFASLVNTKRGDEPMQVAHAFADKTDWTLLDPDWLEQQEDALSFFSHEAICFYIPAFIAADLKGQLGNPDPVFALTHGFADGTGAERIHPRKPETWSDYARARWAGLTSPQARAIVHYLEWKIAGTGVQRQPRATEALHAFWYERASA
jgi:hypothetical protein